MKSTIVLTTALAALLWAGDAAAQSDQESVISKKADVYSVTANIRFNEGTVAVKNRGILLSNFGTDACDPLNKEGRGYIVQLSKENKILIPASGALSAPKGMAVKGDCLFVADVGCVVAFNLRKPELRPVRIGFPDGEVFVNDILAIDDFLLVSVTNTGHLYTLDVSDCAAYWEGVRPKPKMAATIPGANGLAEHEGTLYIASYDPNEQPGVQNVIYAVDMTTPEAKPVNLVGERPGQYDGIAVSEDGTKLYFSNWKNAGGKAEVGYIDLAPGKNNAITIFDLGVDLKGPADICVSDGYLFIPDLPASTLYIMAL